MVAGELNADNMTAIAAEGGISVVLAVMTAHTERTDVQVQGCKALSILAVDDNSKREIVAARGIHVVLAAMTAHMGHTDVQELGCAVLGNIGWSNTTLQQHIKDEGGVVVVQAALAASGATTNCKKYGQTLLGKLTVCSDTYIHANVLFNKWTWIDMRECLHTYVQPTYMHKCKTTHMYTNTCEHTKQAYKQKLHNHARIHLYKALSSDNIVPVFAAIFCLVLFLEL